MSLESLDYLNSLGLTLVKIPSGEITNLPYLKKAATLFSEVIISTGMSNMDDIKNALKVFVDAGISKDNISILHCNTEYPTPMKDVNLLAMKTIQTELDIEIGYSDHTLGIEVPIAAVALGTFMKAKIQETSKFANGGIVSGPTMGLVGEYPGASSNPEVIAPLDKLKSMIGESGGGGGTFVLRGQDLLLSVQKAQKSSKLKGQNINLA